MKHFVRAMLVVALIGIAVEALAADQAGTASNQLGMFVGTWHGNGSFAQANKTVHVNGSNTCS